MEDLKKWKIYLYKLISKQQIALKTKLIEHLKVETIRFSNIWYKI